MVVAGWGRSFAAPPKKWGRRARKTGLGAALAVGALVEDGDSGDVLILQDAMQMRYITTVLQRRFKKRGQSRRRKERAPRKEGTNNGFHAARERVTGLPKRSCLDLALLGEGLT
jgi:hypothetical protein